MEIEQQKSLGNFIEIPNNIVWDYEENKNSYISGLKDYRIAKVKVKGKEIEKSLVNKYKIIQIFYALYDLTNGYRNVCRFTISGLAQVGKINITDKDELRSIKLVLDKLVDDKKIIISDNCKQKDKEGNYISFSFESVRADSWIEIIPQYFLKSKKHDKVHYFQLYDFEFNEILSYEKTGVNNSELLVLFCYYVSRIHHREIYIDENGNKRKVTLDLNNSEVTYPKYDDITKDTLISENVVKKYNIILADLGLIMYKNAGNRRLQVEGGKLITISSSNTIALCRDNNPELEIDRSIEAYKASQIKVGYVFVGLEKTEKDKSKKQISNTINRLRFLEKKDGLLSDENRNKLNLYLQKQMENNVIESTAEENIKWSNMKLLDNNKGELLSTIFNNMSRYKEAEKYEDIEVSLGLIDNDNWDDDGEVIKQLLTDWKYYKWVMFNYKEEEHLKYFTYVKDHIKGAKNSNVVGFTKTEKHKGLNDNLKKKSSLITDTPVSDDEEEHEHTEAEYEEAINNYHDIYEIENEWDEQHDYHGDDKNWGGEDYCNDIELSNEEILGLVEDF